LRDFTSGTHIGKPNFKSKKKLLIEVTHLKTHNRFYMLKNYFTTALRNLWRSKGSTIINISGLTLGVATSLILFLLVRNQTSFDKYHSKLDRIYRVVLQSDGNNGKNYSAGVQPVLWEAFKNDFPEAEEVVFTSYHGSGSLVTIPQPQGEPKKFGDDNNLVFTQPEFFKIFDRKILIGDVNKVLKDPNEAVISKKAAINYFGKEDAIGEVLSFEDKEYKVTAIMEDYPDNTDFPFNVMLSYVTIKKSKDEVGWNGIWSDEHCYFLLKEGSSIAEIERRLPDFYKKYLGEKNRDHAEYNTQTLASVHHDERYGNYNYNTTSYEKIAAMSIIGIFLIITACINFINLVTAEAIKRSKEVGIRKTLGSSRGQLIAQFLGESTLVTIFSVVLALGLAQILLPSLNTFLHSTLAIRLGDPTLWLFVFAVTVAVSILSGLYPSFVVSGFKPVFAIKNQIGNRNSSGFNLRRGLVVLQFIISQFLIIATIVMVTQMDFFSNKDLGFVKEAVVNIPIPENARGGFEDGTSKMKTLREELVKLKGIEDATLCNFPPSSGAVMSTNFWLEGKTDDFDAQMKSVDVNYIQLYGMKLVAGKNIGDSDTVQGFVINEKLANMFGYANPTDAIGQRMRQGSRKVYYPIEGVVQNFHTMSLHEPIEPTVLLSNARNFSTLSIKVDVRSFKESVKEIQQKWEATYPNHIFSYQFLDEEIKEFYESDTKMSTMITVFTSIAIFIGCLGLFGLATFMANQKTKEVGVRKVLGASVESIVLLFSKEYVKLILIGFLFAAPLAWYVMKGWLDNFTYKIELGPSIFFIGFGVAFVIAILTVGYRSLRAATANPVKSLRSE
jgi:ABC-type antimicrobial peptide transport system permease subunit